MSVCPYMYVLISVCPYVSVWPVWSVWSVWSVYVCLCLCLCVCVSGCPAPTGTPGSQPLAPSVALRSEEDAYLFQRIYKLPWVVEVRGG